VTFRRRAQTWAVTLLLSALTVFMTWPQAAHLATHAYRHYDVYFNMWRLAWIAHALATAPSRIFDGNIFYPEPRALTYSDAMLVEGVFGAPMFWLGFPPVLVHNLLMLGAIVSSGVGVFVLARHLTGSAGAGLIAGVVFAFVPYRFEHLMHMELQWTVWMPWALWALQRTFETRSWKYGALTGLFASLQTLSSIYYGLFLVILLGVVAVVQFVPYVRERSAVREIVAAFAPAPVVLALVCIPYAMPYLQTKSEISGRRESEVMRFSATPTSYLAATPSNVLYGALRVPNRPERRLFPGLLIVLLAIVGIARRHTPLVFIAYFVAAAVAFELSLGLNGITYRLLYDHVSFFQGFRALARVGVFVLLFVAVLGAYGYARLAAGARPLVRRAALAAVVAILVMEYRVASVPLDSYPNDAPPLHTFLASQPPGVVAEVPMPVMENWPGVDARISYLSTFHWHPMVNGYSGFMPQSYADRLAALRDFPDDRALARLHQDAVRYLVVHLTHYRATEVASILDTLGRRHGLAELGRFWDGDGEAVVFALR
jgi:hypothetical protein